MYVGFGSLAQQGFSYALCRQAGFLDGLHRGQDPRFFDNVDRPCSRQLLIGLKR